MTRGRLPSSSMHLPVRVEPELIGISRSRAFRKLLSNLRAAIIASRPGGLDEGPHLVSRGTITKRLAEVDSVVGIKTEVPSTIGG